MNQVYDQFIELSSLGGHAQAELMGKRGFNVSTLCNLLFVCADKDKTEKIIGAWRGEGTFSDKELKDVGFLVEGGDGELFIVPQLTSGEIIIPYLDVDGDVYHLRAHKFGLKGRGIELYCPYLIKENDGHIILTEGEFKAAAAWQMGFPSLAVPGISSFGGVHFQRFVDLLRKHEIDHVTVIFDNEVKDDPILPSYKPDPMKRWETDFWAIRMARQLIDAGIEADVGRLPDEWCINGKIDVDGALAAGHEGDEFQEIVDGALHPDEYMLTLCDEAREVILAKFAKAEEPPYKFNSYEEAEAWIHHLNQNHAVVMSSGKAMVMNFGHDHVFERRLITYSEFEHYLKRYRNKTITIADKRYKLADFWLDHPRQRQFMDGVVFLPGQGQRPGRFNLWNGFAVKPNEGYCKLFLEHLAEVICDGDEDVARWVLNWLADCVQHPGRRPGTALVL